MLDRVLVLPRFNCFCDRYWYPYCRCVVFPDQPFKSTQACPLDQIIDVGAFWERTSSLTLAWMAFWSIQCRSARRVASSTRRLLDPVSSEGVSRRFRVGVARVRRCQGPVLRLPIGKPRRSALDRDVSRLFKGDWCCHQNGSMPFAAHAPVEASEAGALDAGPAADVDTIRRAKEVWALTAPERDKWQARIFCVRFEEGTGMSEHNHYAC